jgi:hypothetical protein
MMTSRSNGVVRGFCDDTRKLAAQKLLEAQTLLETIALLEPRAMAALDFTREARHTLNVTT